MMFAFPGVGPSASFVAGDAARRAGIAVERWMNAAISGQALNPSARGRYDAARGRIVPRTPLDTSKTNKALKLILEAEIADRAAATALEAIARVLRDVNPRTGIAKGERKASDPNASRLPQREEPAWDSQYASFPPSIDLHFTISAIARRQRDLGADRERPKRQRRVFEENDASSQERDASATVEDLKPELQALARKVEVRINSSIDPRIIDQMRRDSSEVRTLLASAAERSTSLERILQQIEAAVDGMSRLAEIEERTRASGFRSIEARLDDIPTHLVEVRGCCAPCAYDSVSLADIERRIEATSEKLGAGFKHALDVSALQPALEALTERLARETSQSTANLLMGIDAKLAATASNDALLADISAKLNRFAFPAANTEQEGDAGETSREFAKRVAEEVIRRMKTLTRAPVDYADPAESLRHLGDQIAMLEDPIKRVEPAIRGIQDLLQRIAANAAPSEVKDSEIAAKIERATATEATGGLRAEAQPTAIDDLLRRLNDRIGGIGVGVEGEIAGDNTGASSPTCRLGQQHASFAPFIDPPLAQSSGEFDADEAKADDNSAGAPMEEDELLEPGSDGLQRRPASSQTPSALTAHIAAARRAAQPAVVPSSNGPSSTSRLNASASRLNSYVDRHRRSLLLAIALAIGASGAARLISGNSAFLHRRATLERDARFDSAESGNQKANGSTPRATQIDMAPTASIGASGSAKLTVPSLKPALEIPMGVAQPLRDDLITEVPQAGYELARRFYEGRGMQENQQAAGLWFERAASLGFAPAALRLGAMYQRGVGVVRDLAAAKRWYSKAAEAGNARAAHNLAVMEAESEGEKTANYTAAATWFRKAGELGVRDSQFNLGVLLARGLGVDQNFRQAWLWFSLAAAQGDVDAAAKRDEVAAKMDAASLEAAANDLAKFQVRKPDPAANEVISPAVGW